MKLSPLKLGLIGVLAYLASVAWVFLYFHIAKRNDPTGWILDRPTPDAPKLVAMIGVVFVVASVAWAVMRVVRSRAQ